MSRGSATESTGSSRRMEFGYRFEDGNSRPKGEAAADGTPLPRLQRGFKS
jgi:hypothetical protein